MEEPNLSRLQKLRLLRAQNERYYLLDHPRLPEACVKPPWIFRVSGSTLNVYTVRIVGGTTGRIECDCPDGLRAQQRHSSSSATPYICKHACFVIRRVLRLRDNATIIANRSLNSSDIQEAAQRLHDINNTDSTDNIGDDGIIDENLTRRLQKALELKSSASAAFSVTREIKQDKECPICYTELLDGTSSSLVACPTCRNSFHSKCMQRWLASAPKPTCVCCRSLAWTHYKTNGGGSYISLLT